jgi:phage terminase small subunit
VYILFFYNEKKMKLEFILIFIIFVHFIICENENDPDKCCLLKSDENINEENIIRFAITDPEKFDDYLNLLKEQGSNLYEKIVKLIEEDELKDIKAHICFMLEDYPDEYKKYLNSVEKVGLLASYRNVVKFVKKNGGVIKNSIVSKKYEL